MVLTLGSNFFRDLWLIEISIFYSVHKCGMGHQMFISHSVFLLLGDTVRDLPVHVGEVPGPRQAHVAENARRGDPARLL